jgi:hypothetical protein
MAVFWYIAPCSLVLTDVSEEHVFIIALMMEGVRSSETSVNIYQTTRRNIPEDSHIQFLHNHRQDRGISLSQEPIHLNVNKKIREKERQKRRCEENKYEYKKHKHK